MAVQAAVGFPQQSGILIPEVWSAKLLVKFYATTVLGSICNTEYDGDISGQGDKVWIRTTPDIQIKKYYKGQTLDIQRPTPNKISMTIDQANYWNFVVDDIDKFQSDINFFENWTGDATQQMKIAIDTEILGQVYADADPANSGAAAGLQTGAINLGAPGAPLVVGNATGNVTPTDFVLRIMQALDEQNVPDQDRSITIPPWLAQKLKNSDLKNAYLTGDAKSPLRSGRIGDIDRATLYISNLLSQVTDSTSAKCTHVIGLQKNAVCFATQLVENEMIKAESTFGYLGRGLQVYGHLTMKPQALVHAYVTPGG